MAYTDPTGLSALAPCLPVQAVPISIGFMGFGVIWKSPLATSITVPSLRGKTMDVPAIKIPPPPMGSLVLITYPPVYKEKHAGSGLVGQIYPPKAP
jgi:hypothetical protein